MGMKSDCNKFRGRRSPRITIIPLQAAQRDWRIFRSVFTGTCDFFPIFSFFFFFVISRVGTGWKVTRFR